MIMTILESLQEENRKLKAERDAFLGDLKEICPEMLEPTNLVNGKPDLQGWLVSWNEFIDRICQAWPEEHPGYNDCPFELLTRLIDERDEVLTERDALAKRCIWKEDEDGVWFGTCGIAWVFQDSGSVKDHGCNFCPHCGHPIEAQEYKESEVTP
jgi:hypothetical protein